MVKNGIKMILKAQLVKEMVTILIIGILVIIFSWLDCILFSSGISQSLDSLITVVFMRSILNYIYFYTIYLLSKTFTRGLKEKKLFFSGLICIIGGVLAFFVTSLIYVGANMDFISFMHCFSMYLAPIMVFIGIALLILTFVKRLKKTTKQDVLSNS